MATMYLTDHDTMTPGAWMRQDITAGLRRPAQQRIVLFKTRGLRHPPLTPDTMRADPQARGRNDG